MSDINEQDQEREAIVESLFTDIATLREVQQALFNWFDKHGYEITHDQNGSWYASLKADIEAKKVVVVDDKGQTITYFNHQPLFFWKTYGEMVITLLEQIDQQINNP